MVLAVEAVRACLRAESGGGATWPQIPDGLQPAVVDAITEQRVTWLVLAHAEQLGISGHALEDLRDVASADIRAAMRVQSAAAALVGGLNDAGIRCLTYKGVALALQTTGDPAARGACDLDLLFSPEDMPRAHAFLIEQGAEVVEGYSPSPADDLWPLAQRIGCEVPYRWRGVDLDVHWRFDRLPQIAAIPFDDLWAQRDEVVVGGRSLPTLGSVDALLLTCAHGTKEHWRHLRWVVDVVRQCRDEFDWDVVRQRARETGCETSLAVGLAIADRLMGEAAAPSGPVPGPRARALADQAWSNLCSGAAPFGRVAFSAQVERLGWTWQTLPTPGAVGSFLLRQGYTTLDMAERPLPMSLAWAYPVVRVGLWSRRLRTGRYGAAALGA